MLLQHRLFSKYDDRKREHTLSDRFSTKVSMLDQYLLIEEAICWLLYHITVLILVIYWSLLFKDISDFRFQCGSTFEKGVSFP